MHIEDTEWLVKEIERKRIALIGIHLPRHHRAI